MKKMTKVASLVAGLTIAIAASLALYLHISDGPASTAVAPAAAKATAVPKAPAVTWSVNNMILAINVANAADALNGVNAWQDGPQILAYAANVFNLWQGATPPTTCPVGMDPRLYSDSVQMVDYAQTGMYDQALVAGTDALIDAHIEYPGDGTITHDAHWMQQNGGLIYNTNLSVGGSGRQINYGSNLLPTS